MKEWSVNVEFLIRRRLLLTLKSQAVSHASWCYYCCEWLLFAARDAPAAVRCVLGVHVERVLLDVDVAARTSVAIWNFDALFLSCNVVPVLALVKKFAEIVPDCYEAIRLTASLAAEHHILDFLTAVSGCVG